MSKKLSVVVIAAGLIVVGCSGSTTSDSPTEEELASEAAPDSSGVETTTTTVTPTTTEAPTTTVAPTTTQATTTTVDEDVAVVQQLYVLGQVEAGNAEFDPVRDTMLELAESIVGSIGRVDVVTSKVANEVGIQVIVQAASGFSSREYQNEAAVDFVAEWARQLWTPGWFGNILESGEGGVDFNFTMDGRNWVIPAQTMIDISNRRISAQSALGL